jgi:hypothetical protein
MCTLILILISTYAQYQPYIQSPIRYFDTSASIPYNSFNTVAIKLKTMSTNSDNIDEKPHDLPGTDWLSVGRKPKSSSTQRSAGRVSSKSGKKSPKYPPSKRSSTGLHNQDSDISLDRQKKKTPLPLDKINGDIRNMFTVTGTGPITTPPQATTPYVPNPIHVTKLMKTVTKQAASRSISPKSRTVDANTVVTPGQTDGGCNYQPQDDSSDGDNRQTHRTCRQNYERNHYTHCKHD